MTMRRALTLALVALASSALLLGCGKKGPPLPPLVGAKPRVKDLDVRQVGTTVRGRFSLPVRAGADTVDYRTKAVELWRRPVAKPPEGAGDGKAKGEATVAKPKPPPTAPPRQPGAPGEEQEQPGLPVGEFTKTAVLAQSISEQDLFDLLASPQPEMVDQLPPELYGQELEYAIVLKTDIKSSGTVSDLATITPVEPPKPPTDVGAKAVEGAVRLTWTPADAGDGKTVPVNVYRAEPDLPMGTVPYNEKPVDKPPFDDVRVTEGGTYRYVLRSVIPGEKIPVESDAATEVATVYQDRFAPAVPEGLRAFVDSGRVTLLWTPNDERDLLGYLVHRRAVGGEWTQLNAQPLPSATYTDATASPGAKYEYSVSSVDRATPPNESARARPVLAEIRGE